MLIRIRCLDIECQETQVAEPEGISAALFAVLTACYAGRKSVFRVLGGSI